MGEVVAMKPPTSAVLPEDVSFLAMAYLLGCQSTCARGHVGALAVKNGQVVASGYNKPPGGVCRGIEGCKAQEGCTRALHAAQHLLDSAPPEALRGATVYISMPPARAHYEALIARGVERIVAGPRHHRARPDDCPGTVQVESVEHERVALLATDALRRDHLPRRLVPVAGDRFGRLVEPPPTGRDGAACQMSIRRLDGPDVAGGARFALYDAAHDLPSLVVSLSELWAWATWLSTPPHVRFWQVEVLPFSLLTSVSTAIQAIRDFKTPPVIFVYEDNGALALDIWTIPPTFVRPQTRAQAEALYQAYSAWASTHRAALTSQEDEHIDFVPPEAPGRVPGPWSRSRAQRMLGAGEPNLWMAPRTTTLSEEAKQMLRKDYGTDIGATWAATLAHLERVADRSLEYIVDPEDEMVAWAVDTARQIAARFNDLAAQWDAANRLPGTPNDACAAPVGNSAAPADASADGSASEAT